MQDVTLVNVGQAPEQLEQEELGERERERGEGIC